jgi:hypothetical protein
MSAQARKLLVVEYPDGTWRVMLERTDKTLSLQLPASDGMALMEALVETVVTNAVQKGWVRIS